MATKNFDLTQTLTQIELRGLADLGAMTLPGLLIHDDILSRPMTHLLANFKYVCLFDVWAQKFDNLRWTLTYALLAWWMYSFWL